MENYQVTLTRGRYGLESLLIRGDIAAWLLANHARPTKDPNRFVVGGWRCVVRQISDETVSRMERIFGREYAK